MYLEAIWNENGYRIEDGSGMTLYTAGNSRYDSGAFVDPRYPPALTSAEIERYAMQTLQEMCDENGATNGGCTFDPEVNK